jgi:predicted small lipoprotein YifL
MMARAGLGVLAVALTVSGCGLKGPLYLPEKPGPVTTRPAAPATAPAAPPATPVETPPLPPPAGDKTGG